MSRHYISFVLKILIWNVVEWKDNEKVGMLWERKKTLSRGPTYFAFLFETIDTWDLQINWLLWRIQFNKLNSGKKIFT